MSPRTWPRDSSVPDRVSTRWTIYKVNASNGEDTQRVIYTCFARDECASRWGCASWYAEVVMGKLHRWFGNERYFSGIPSAILGIKKGAGDVPKFKKNSNTFYTLSSHLVHRINSVYESRWAVNETLFDTCCESSDTGLTIRQVQEICFAGGIGNIIETLDHLDLGSCCFWRYPSRSVILFWGSLVGAHRESYNHT